MRRSLFFILTLALFASCGTSRYSYDPSRKFSPERLQKDYAIYEQILQEAHPGLYWYTSKDSMDHYFNWGREQIRDSMTETGFRQLLNYVTAKINCGHTSVRSSRKFTSYLDTARINQLFPLSLKFWNDTAVVAANLHRRDSILTRGIQVTGLDGRSIPAIVDTLFQYISTDGYNTTHKFQVLSNRGFFGSLYTTVFGNRRFYEVTYNDSLGAGHTTLIKSYSPLSDTLGRAQFPRAQRLPRPTHRERKERMQNAVRLLKIDSTEGVAMMDLNSFARGYRLKKFFRRSFRTLRQHKIDQLMIDVRGNGGGSVTNSTLLSRYMSDHRFKVGDSLYAITKRKTYSRYVKNDFFNRLFITFFTRRKHDGYYHFRYFERHYFKPKRRNHFDGQVYILTGGNSFSATTLFASTLIHQDNVTVVGEETGGGAYGNSAWLIPDVTLPETGVRFRLPLFRLVIDRNYPKTGKGVQPEVFSKPTINAIRKGSDFKLDTVMALIKQYREKRAPNPNQTKEEPRIK